MSDAEIEALAVEIYFLIQDGQVAAAVELLRKALKGEAG